MKNEILAEIVEFAKNKLNDHYGFCGVASGDNMAMLNSMDSRGNDIAISVTLKNDDDE